MTTDSLYIYKRNSISPNSGLVSFCEDGVLNETNGMERNLLDNDTKESLYPSLRKLHVNERGQ